MKLVSPLLKRVVYPCLSSAGILQHHAKDRELSVVTYHGVLPYGYQALDPHLDGSLVSIASLRKQLRFFKANYNVIHPATFCDFLQGNGSLPDRAMLLTCDDGLLNNLTDMLPVLQEESVRFLFFVTADSLQLERRMLWYEQLYLMMLLSSAPASSAWLRGTLRAGPHAYPTTRTLWWSVVKEWSGNSAAERAALIEDARTQFGLQEDWMNAFIDSASRLRRFALLTRPELLQLSAAGMEIGSHTLTHPMLSQSPAQVALEEITQSRSLREELLEKPVWALAYPFGNGESVSDREIHFAQSAGYRCAFLNCEGSATSPFAISRMHMTSDISIPEIQAHLSGFHAAIHRLAGAQPTPVGKGA